VNVKDKLISADVTLLVGEKLFHVMQRNIKKSHSSQERPTKILTTPSWSPSCIDSNIFRPCCFDSTSVCIH